MGRSRAVPHPAEEDSGQRFKRKKTNSNVENVETAAPAQGKTEGKTEGKALYHCNYCNKDISGKVRIKCAVCSDYDLCIECFTVGAEVQPHKSNHPYRVMDNLSFPLICPNWNADEEILLLEGIEMYGLGNWAEVAEHVGTKSKSQCIDHYNAIYMDSPFFPLPDMSHVMGKNREELLAMAREHVEVNTGNSIPDQDKEESLPSLKIKVDDQSIDGSVGRPSSNLISEVGGVGAGGGMAIDKGIAGGAKSAPSIQQNKDNTDVVKIEDRSVGEKKPRISGDEELRVTDISGYNSKRQEFEVEYDNDAEQLLADMEFKESDSDSERELKLRVLRIYSKRLDERKRRKDFILERGLLYPASFDNQLSQEEREMCRRYRVYMRFQSKEEHEEMLRSLIEEHRVLKRIQDLQEARDAGCLTATEAEKFIQQKREAEQSIRIGESSQAGVSGKFPPRAIHPIKGDVESSPREANKGQMAFDNGGKDTPSTIRGLNVINPSDHWDVSCFAGANLLSDTEMQLCNEIRILPSYYLNMLQTMSLGMLNGSITKCSDAYGLFKADPVKVDRVYDVLLKKGIAQK